jgi:DNA-binding transcriptional ArsR family regulator
VAQRPGRPTADGEPDAFAALADPTRRLLLERLAQQECTVTELMEGLTMTQAAVSQHLGLLRRTGLVEARQDGRFRRYRLRPDAFAAFRGWLDALDRFWQERVTALDRLLREQP